MAFPTTAILDTFNRANEDPLSDGGNWVTRGTNNQLLVESNLCRGKVVGQLSSDYWAANSFSANEEAYVTVTTIPSTASDYLRLWARMTLPGQAGETGYVMQWSNDANGCRIFKETARETFTTIATAAAARYVNGDQLGIACIGTDITIYKNGTLVLTVSDATFVSGGNIALGGRGISYRLDDFGGGTVVVPSTFVPRVLVF